MAHWIYHPTQEAKIVDEKEFLEYLNNGWFDTPAKFINKNNIEKIEINFLKKNYSKKKGRPRKEYN